MSTNTGLNPALSLEQQLANLSPGALTDAGDLPLSPTAEAREEIEAGIAVLLAGGWRPLALGGTTP